MKLEELLQQLHNNPEVTQFSEVMAVIEQHYNYRATAFSNGLGESKLHNAAGSNEGSCKIFAFAQLNNLSPEQTLACFGDYYRQDVMQHPEGTDHGNIRSFMQHGWAGIHFEQAPLTAP